MYSIIVHIHSQEELLKQLKEKKAQEDEAKEKAKLQKAKKQAKKLKLQDLQKDAERRTKVNFTLVISD